MARRTQAEWEQIGRDAILNLLVDRRVAPWAEIEARISAGWKGFPSVQPLQLSGARKVLRAEGLIEEDTSDQTPPVTTLRLPYVPGQRREIQRLTGAKRKLYRKYLGWAGDQSLCGKHGERVLLECLKASASDAGLYVPPQTLGELREVGGAVIAPGPLDAYALLLDLDASPMTANEFMVIEVKNVSTWIYPWAPELWEMLIKAAYLAAQDVAVLPVLACVRAAWPTYQLAKDIGFFTCEFQSQTFSLRIPELDFDEVRHEFGLPIIRTDGPVESVLTFLRRTLRASPPPTPPADEVTPWYRRQIERFSSVAPIILRHADLGKVTGTNVRRRAFGAFAAEIREAVDWPILGGY